MSEQHDAIDELLAAHVLRTLSGADAVEAERLLGEHVPQCAACKQTLDAFQGVVGDLGLAATPRRPPDTLLAALHREMQPPTRRRRIATWVAAAAAALAIAGLGGVTSTQLFADGSTGLAVADLAGALAFATRDDVQAQEIGPAREVWAPGQEEFYLYSSDCPPPPPGQEYRVWVVAADRQTEYLGSFVPTSDGHFVLHGWVDPGSDGLLITLESTDAAPASPGPPAWGD